MLIILKGNLSVFTIAHSVMKIAAISDIHSNIYALRAVIDDINKYGVDVSLNLGDILYGPIAPQATFELLMEKNFITIRGNQDRQIYEATSEEIHSNPTMEFILSDLEPEALDWMRGLAFDLQLNEDVYLCHGTPQDDLVYLLEDVQSGFAILRNDQEILENLGKQVSNVILCGHTHTPRAVTTSTGQLIVNPGSVGLPAYMDCDPVKHSIQNFSHHASYAIIEGSGKHWSVQHIKVDYDFQKAVNDAIKRERYDWEHFLSTGRKI